MKMMALILVMGAIYANAGEPRCRLEITFEENPRFTNISRSLSVRFSEPLPRPEIMDKVLRTSLDAAVQLDPSRDIFADVRRGDSILDESDYGGGLMFIASNRQIVCSDVFRAKTISEIRTGYRIETVERRGLVLKDPAITNRSSLWISVIFSNMVPIETAETICRNEIKRFAYKGLDIYINPVIGTRGFDKPWRGLPFPDVGELCLSYMASNRVTYFRDKPWPPLKMKSF